MFSRHLRRFVTVRPSSEPWSQPKAVRAQSTFLPSRSGKTQGAKNLMSAATSSQPTPVSPTFIGFQADSLLPKKASTVHSAKINGQGRLEVVINGQSMQFPGEYLRRNCQCSKCFNNYSLSYVSALQQIFSAGTELATVAVTKDGVTCEFVDGHSGTFSSEWLFNRRMTSDGRTEREKAVFAHDTVPWPEPSDMVVQKCSWADVTETEVGFEKFGNSLVRDGIFVITGAPTDRYLYEEFYDKTGMFASANHYGPLFVVESQAVPLNHSYTPVELDLHIDQTYLTRCPGIQLLHCIAQSPNGGENVMCDGIKAAMVLRERHPEYFQILSQLPVVHEDLLAHKGQHHYYMAAKSPTIVVDENGEPATIQLNHAASSSFFQGTPEEYELYTKALRKFFDVLYEQAIHLKVSPGDILAFDNERVLHGRLSYDASHARKLEGWYLEWDMMHSRLRVNKIRQSVTNN